MARELSIPPDELARQKMRMRIRREAADESDAHLAEKKQGQLDLPPDHHCDRTGEQRQPSDRT